MPSSFSILVPVKPKEVPEDLICSICFGVPLDPAMTWSCEHVYCKSCLQTALEKTPSCPICRSSCQVHEIKDLKPGTFAYRVWSAIPVKCGQEGCCWMGTIADGVVHSSKCSSRAQQRELLLERVEAERDELRQQVHQLENEKAELEKNLAIVTDLNDQLKASPLFQLPVLFDGRHYYPRHLVTRLSQLISRYLENKPDQIDRNKIFSCVQKRYRDLQRGWGDNPPHYHINMRMLLCTCAASTWFTDNQLKSIQRWLREQQWD